MLCLNRTNVTDQRLARAQQLAAKKFSALHVRGADQGYKLDVVPTGSLMLDYKTGIGGFPYGHMVEVYGGNRLGKSSAVGFPVLANVQKQGGLPCLIAVEPRLVTPGDQAWAKKLGLDVNNLLVLYPDTIEETFDMLRDLVFTNLVDYIMVDSIGGSGTDKSAKVDGKQQAYGISSTVTAGLNDIMPRLWKNNIGLLLINQQRQAPSPAGRPGLRIFESPGGEGLKHHARMRIHLKPGAEQFTATVDGESILVGRELVCVFRKNSLSESQDKQAKFNFYHIETDLYGFGIDTAQDIINVGKLTKVIQEPSKGWFEHAAFPKKIHGANGVREFLDSHPQAYEQIREEVMAIMAQNEREASRKKQESLQIKQPEVNNE